MNQMIIFYKIAINFLFVIALPVLPFMYLLSEKRRATLAQRLGINTRFKPKPANQQRVWIHALSVGEVISAVPLVHAIKEKNRDLDIVFTVSTKTGFDMANQLFLNGNVRVVGQLGYFPFDLGLCVKKIGRKISADAVILVETDLWPNFLYEMKKSGTPVVLINARLSKRSLKGYLAIKKFSSLFFSSLTGILAQTRLDEKRFLSLGIDKSKLKVTGNIKFDQPVPEMDQNRLDKMRGFWGVQKETPVFVAGSTHAGEEKILGNVYKELGKTLPGVLMILAPRDPKRCPDILSHFMSCDVPAVVMSRLDKDNRPGVVLVDKMGELSRLYALCDVAFIGGSMVRQGGHNPLEPAAFSKPILFGPDMSDFLLISKLLLDHGAARQVASGQELAKALETLLKDRQVKKEMGTRSFEIFSRNSGAVHKIINHLEHLGIV